MTNPSPHNPFGPAGGDPFGGDPFGGAPFGGGSFGQPPTGPPLMPPGQQPASVLATLSLLLAFVFAPAGAVLGHLGLAEIRRTGRSGRGLALAGLICSYTMIVISAVALTVWAVRVPGPNAAPARPTAAAPAPATSPPRRAMVTDLVRLLPDQDQIRALTGINGLTRYKPQISLGDAAGTVDRRECIPVRWIFDTRVPIGDKFFGLYGIEYVADQMTVQINPGAMSFTDAAAAQAALQNQLANWRSCGGGPFQLKEPILGGTIDYHAGEPADAGDGITTLSYSRDGVTEIEDRAIAAKGNILVYVRTVGPTSRSAEAVAVAKFILDKIPG